MLLLTGGRGIWLAALLGESLSLLLGLLLLRRGRRAPS